MIVYGGAIGDGNRHTHNNLPVVVAGKGNGTIRGGRHVRYPTNTPMANLFLNILDIFGVPTERIGDSAGRLKGISGFISIRSPGSFQNEGVLLLARH